MNIPFDSVPKKWYQKPKIWILIIVLLLILTIILIIAILLIKNAKKNNTTHIHYTRMNTNIYPSGYELYRLNVLPQRNPSKQYKLLADFLRISLFNRSTYEQLLPLCPIIYSMSSVDHPDDWRGMLFGAINLPHKNIPYPYVCYLSVLPSNRRHQLASILLNQFINEMSRISESSSLTHIQLHANWENCRAQKLYHRCGFRCNEFTSNGYSKPFESEYQFGHMIRMELNLANVKDLTQVCRMTQAVEISQVEEDNYVKLCNKNLPNGINRTCDDQI